MPPKNRDRNSSPRERRSITNKEYNDLLHKICCLEESIADINTNIDINNDPAYLLEDGSLNPNSAPPAVYISTPLNYDPNGSQLMLSDGTNVRVYQNFLAQATDTFYTNPKDFTTIVGPFADWDDANGLYSQSQRQQVYDPTDGYYEIYDWVSNAQDFSYFAENYLYIDEGMNPEAYAYMSASGVNAGGDYNALMDMSPNANTFSLNGTDTNGAFTSGFIIQNGFADEAIYFFRDGIDDTGDAYTSQMAITESNTNMNRSGVAANGNAFSTNVSLGPANTTMFRTGENGNGVWSATFQTGGNNGTITQVNRTGFSPSGYALGMNMILNEVERVAFQRRQETGVGTGIFREQDFGFYGDGVAFGGLRTSRFYHVHANGTDLNQMQIQDAEYKIKYRENNATLERSITMTDSLFELERYKAGTNVKLALVDAGTILTGGDAEIVGSSNGLILESPDTTRWRVTIDNTGNLTTATV